MFIVIANMKSDSIGEYTMKILVAPNAFKGALSAIEAADWIYGVTMEEPGVSRIVGVRLEDALQVSGSSGS